MPVVEQLFPSWCVKSHPFTSQRKMEKGAVLCLVPLTKCQPSTCSPSSAQGSTGVCTAPGELWLEGLEQCTATPEHVGARRPGTSSLPGKWEHPVSYSWNQGKQPWSCELLQTLPSALRAHQHCWEHRRPGWEQSEWLVQLAERSHH